MSYCVEYELMQYSHTEDGDTEQLEITFSESDLEQLAYGGIVQIETENGSIVFKRSTA